MAKLEGWSWRKAAGLILAQGKNTCLRTGSLPRSAGCLTTSAGSSWPVQADPSAQISPESRIEGGSYVGAWCEVEEDVLLEDSILFPGSFVPRGTTLRSCVVAGVRIDPGTYLETDFV